MVKVNKVPSTDISDSTKKRVCVRTSLPQFKAKVNKNTKKVVYNKPIELGATWEEFLSEHGIKVDKNSHRIRWGGESSPVNAKISNLWGKATQVKGSGLKYSFTVHIEGNDMKNQKPSKKSNAKEPKKKENPIKKRISRGRMVKKFVV